MLAFALPYSEAFWFYFKLFFFFFIFLLQVGISLPKHGMGTTGEDTLLFLTSVLSCITKTSVHLVRTEPSPPFSVLA